jgi:acyl carrier protein phosphodiesterase
MNFLAHLHLSGDNMDIRFGNFIADFVKGKAYQEYPQKIQNGILLHRQIDFYTDNHPITAAAKKELYPNYHKYAAVVLDIFFDHFLAVNWKSYSAVSLENFAGKFYADFPAYESLMPEQVKQFYPYMVKNNWLVNYGLFYGIERSLEGMSRRAKHVSGMENAVNDLKEKYDFFQEKFRAFYPELMNHVESTGLLND